VTASDLSQPITGPLGEVVDSELGRVAAPRLARHTFTLADGHPVGVAVSGRGVPLVVIHGYSAEGFLYAQTLNRLVLRGFKVIAIDMAGHGSTQGLPLGGASLDDYASLLGRTVDELGVKSAVFAGHSMGGRVVTHYAAHNPDRVIAALLLDAIVGDTWDLMVNAFRLAPWLMPPFGVALLVDSVTTVPVLNDRQQAAKFLRLLTPTLVGHALEPWRLIGPAVSILRSASSRPLLEQLADREIPTFVIHGDRDLIVPIRTARDAAKRAQCQLVTIHNGAHSWLLRDPETLPAIVEELLGGRLGEAIRERLSAAGAVSVDDLEALFYEPKAPILELTPPLSFTTTTEAHRRPLYRWTVSEPT
jgi:pimeloyl-ACP methyl ester carboxylesterase